MRNLLFGFNKMPLICAFVSFSCASVSTELTPVVSAKYSGQKYSRILASSTTGDLKFRQSRELLMCEKLTEQKVQCLRAFDIFPPTDSFSNNELVEVLKEHKIDAILELGAVDTSVSSSYVPPTYNTSCNRGAFGSVSCNTYQTGGGYNVNKPNGSYRSRLIDVNSGDVVWMADVQANGNGYSSFSNLEVETTKEVVTNLEKSGFLAPLYVEDRKISSEGK